MSYVLAYIPFSADGEHTVKTALCIALRINARLLIMNSEIEPQYPDMARSEFFRYITTSNPASGSAVIRYITEADLSPVEFGDKIITGTIRLVITSGGSAGQDQSSLLKKFKCPVLLVNNDSHLGSISKICYLTDLRYCDLSTLQPMIEFFRPFSPEWIIVHITNAGLPDLAQKYAETLFNDNIRRSVNYKKMVLINLKGEHIADDLKNVAEIIEPDLAVIPSGQYEYAGLFQLPEKPATGYAHMPLLLMN